MLSTPGLIIIWPTAKEVVDIANTQLIICHDVELFAIVSQLPSSTISRRYPAGTMLPIPGVSINWPTAEQIFDISNQQHIRFHHVAVFPIVNQVPRSAILRGYIPESYLSMPTLCSPPLASLSFGVWLTSCSILLINNVSYVTMLDYLQL